MSKRTTNHLRVRITPELDAAVRLLAARQERSLSATVRLLLADSIVRSVMEEGSQNTGAQEIRRTLSHHLTNELECERENDETMHEVRCDTTAP